MSDPKIVEAVQAASGEAFRRSLVETKTIWSEEIFLAALHEQGYTVVPVEPTEAMYTAWETEWLSDLPGNCEWHNAYRAMIQAGGGDV